MITPAGFGRPCAVLSRAGLGARGATTLATAAAGWRCVRGMHDGAAGIRPRPLASTKLGRAAQSVVTVLLVAEDRLEAGSASLG